MDSIVDVLLIKRLIGQICSVADYIAAVSRLPDVRFNVETLRLNLCNHQYA